MKNEWLRVGLTIGMHFACLLLAFSTIYIYTGIRDEGAMPFRFYFILPISIFILSLVVYFSLEESWKTIAKLFLYTFSMLLLGVVGYGIKVVIYHIFGDPIKSPFEYGVIALVAGGSLLWVVIKIMDSKWLS